MQIKTDICIIGAGPGGATAALFLAKKGIASVLVDKAVFPRDKICGDALSGKVVDTLMKLDTSIVDDLSNFKEALPCWGVNFVSPGRHSLRVPFSGNSSQNKSESKAPGYISTRFDFDSFLIDLVRKQDDMIQLVEQCELLEVERSTEGYLLRSKDNEVEIRSRIVLAADGAHSVFVRSLGQSAIEPAHYCAAIRAYYNNVSQLDEQNFIELHYLKELLPGYFWIFPLPNGMANVGLGIRSDVIRKKKLKLKALLPQIISTYFPERFKDATLEGKVQGYGLPLGTRKRSISGDNYMLIGDAASLIDPFTGEGIGNAMISALEAAEQCERCLSLNRFSANFMRQYDQAVYRKLWEELKLSRRLQYLVNYPWLFDFIVRKANKNKVLSETISCMFEDIDLRARLKNPAFYFKMLFS